MEAIKIIQQYWEQLKRLGIFAQYCAENDIRTVICHDFWIWVVVASVGIGTLVLLLCFKRLIKEQLEYRRNRKRLEARAIVADAETMEQHKWKGDDSDVPLSHEELAEQIRKAKAEAPRSSEHA